jgi:hypothetical protein
VGDLGIVTSSRDTTIKIWAEDSPTSYSVVHTLVSCSCCCCSGHASSQTAANQARPSVS